MLVTASLPSRLCQTFQLADLGEQSLSPWADVFRGHTRGVIAGADAGVVEVIVKKTAATRARALAMAEWTRGLADAGVAVVTPLRLGVANPAPLAAEAEPSADHIATTPAIQADATPGRETDWWVAYPFIDGEPYRATREQIRAAGDLLGRLHSADLAADLRRRLRPYSWPDTSREDVDTDLSTLDAALLRHGGEHAEAAVSRVRQMAERWWSSSLGALLRADEADPLPRAGVSSDYKASNLVFVEGEAVLVDPDNGGLEPRIFDLALAAILFHNECPDAPGRLLDAAEWAEFVGAYTQHIDLTDRERDLWPMALDHMLWEEGSWVLEDNDDDAWADPRQGAQLVDLALSGPERFPLPAR